MKGTVDIGSEYGNLWLDWRFREQTSWLVQRKHSKTFRNDLMIHKISNSESIRGVARRLTENAPPPPSAKPPTAENHGFPVIWHQNESDPD